MQAGSNDAIYSFLLRSIISYIVVPLDLPASHPRLRGIVRVSESRARAFVAVNDRMAAGVGVEFHLSSDEGMLDIYAALQSIKALLESRSGLDEAADLIEDSHGNMVLPAESLESIIGGRESFGVAPGLFLLLGTVLGANISTRFDDSYDLVGFMLLSDWRCRLYICLPGEDVNYGIDFPLLQASGKPNMWIGASLPQELAALARTGDLMMQSTLDSFDEYCQRVFDFTLWVNPPPLDPTKSRSKYI